MTSSQMKRLRHPFRHDNSYKQTPWADGLSARVRLAHLVFLSSRLLYRICFTAFYQAAVAASPSPGGEDAGAYLPATAHGVHLTWESNCTPAVHLGPIPTLIEIRFRNLRLAIPTVVRPSPEPAATSPQPALPRLSGSSSRLPTRPPTAPHSITTQMPESAPVPFCSQHLLPHHQHL
jgi:hypothetical protein